MAIVSIGKNNAAILSGEADLSTWSDEELLRGQRRDKNGKWGGRPPKVVPAELHNEIARRRLDESYQVIRDSLLDAVKLWADVVRDPQADMKYRMQASENIAKHGLPPKPLHVKIEPVQQWEQAIASAVVSMPAELIDAIEAQSYDADEPTYAYDPDE